jgi:16S rRNA (cytidine1402-2'-O)-methyltransferase
MTLGVLYLIPAPLGESTLDQTLPSAVVRTVQQLQLFVVENAKTARRLLKWMGHPSPLPTIQMITLNEHSATSEVTAALQPLLSGQDAGLMSEAGCPAVADPGANLVRAAHLAGIRVAPLVGPSSILLALMASGLDGQRFAFHGYLPTERTQRARRLLDLERDSRARRETQIFIETPYRNQALLHAILQTCDARTLLCVASDISTVGESIRTQSVLRWRAAAPPDLDKRPTIFLILAL